MELFSRLKGWFAYDFGNMFTRDGRQMRRTMREIREGTNLVRSLKRSLGEPTVDEALELYRSANRAPMNRTTDATDPLDRSCHKCRKPIGPGGRRGGAVMGGGDLLKLMEDRAIYGCKSCGTPFCMDCMAALKKHGGGACPACNKVPGW